MASNWKYIGELDPWIFDFIMSPSTTSIKAERIYTLRYISGPNEDGSIVKTGTDLFLSIPVRFSHQALRQFAIDINSQSLEAHEEFNRALILLKEYQLKFIPGANKETSTFELVVDNFSLWYNIEHLYPSLEPVECMKMDAVKQKAHQLWRSHQKRKVLQASQEASAASGENMAEVYSMDSIPLSQLIQQMEAHSQDGDDQEPPDGDHTTDQEEERTDRQRPSAQERDDLSAVRGALLPEDCQLELLGPDNLGTQLPSDMVDAIFYVSANQEEQLCQIEEWSPNYRPPRVQYCPPSTDESPRRHHLPTRNGTKSGESSRECTSPRSHRSSAKKSSTLESTISEQEEALVIKEDRSRRNEKRAAASVGSKVPGHIDSHASSPTKKHLEHSNSDSRKSQGSVEDDITGIDMSVQVGNSLMMADRSDQADMAVQVPSQCLTASTCADSDSSQELTTKATRTITHTPVKTSDSATGTLQSHSGNSVTTSTHSPMNKNSCSPLTKSSSTRGSDPLQNTQGQRMLSSSEERRDLLGSLAEVQLPIREAPKLSQAQGPSPLDKTCQYPIPTCGSTMAEEVGDYMETVDLSLSESCASELSPNRSHIRFSSDPEEPSPNPSPCKTFGIRAGSVPMRDCSVLIEKIDVVSPKLLQSSEKSGCNTASKDSESEMIIDIPTSPRPPMGRQNLPRVSEGKADFSGPRSGVGLPICGTLQASPPLDGASKDTFATTMAEDIGDYMETADLSLSESCASELSPNRSHIRFSSGPEEPSPNPSPKPCKVFGTVCEASPVKDCSVVLEKINVVSPESSVLHRQLGSLSTPRHIEREEIVSPTPPRPSMGDKSFRSRANIKKSLEAALLEQSAVEADPANESISQNIVTKDIHNSRSPEEELSVIVSSATSRQDGKMATPNYTNQEEPPLTATKQSKRQNGHATRLGDVLVEGVYDQTRQDSEHEAGSSHERKVVSNAVREKVEEGQLEGAFSDKTSPVVILERMDRLLQRSPVVMLERIDFSNLPVQLAVSVADIEGAMRKDFVERSPEAQERQPRGSSPLPEMGHRSPSLEVRLARTPRRNCESQKAQQSANKNANNPKNSAESQREHDSETKIDEPAECVGALPFHSTQQSPNVKRRERSLELSVILSPVLPSRAKLADLPQVSPVLEKVLTDESDRNDANKRRTATETNAQRVEDSSEDDEAGAVDDGVDGQRKIEQCASYCEELLSDPDPQDVTTDAPSGGTDSLANGVRRSPRAKKSNVQERRRALRLRRKAQSIFYGESEASPTPSNHNEEEQKLRGRRTKKKSDEDNDWMDTSETVEASKKPQRKGVTKRDRQMVLSSSGTMMVLANALDVPSVDSLYRRDRRQPSGEDKTTGARKRRLNSKFATLGGQLLPMVDEENGPPRRKQRMTTTTATTTSASSETPVVNATSPSSEASSTKRHLREPPRGSKVEEVSRRSLEKPARSESPSDDRQQRAESTGSSPGQPSVPRSPSRPVKRTDLKQSPARRSQSDQRTDARQSPVRRSASGKLYTATPKSPARRRSARSRRSRTPGAEGIRRKSGRVSEVVAVVSCSSSAESGMESGGDLEEEPVAPVANNKHSSCAPAAPADDSVIRVSPDTGSEGSGGRLSLSTPVNSLPSYQPPRADRGRWDRIQEVLQSLQDDTLSETDPLAQLIFPQEFFGQCRNYFADEKYAAN